MTEIIKLIWTYLCLLLAAEQQKGHKVAASLLLCYLSYSLNEQVDWSVFPSSSESNVFHLLSEPPRSLNCCCCCCCSYCSLPVNNERPANRQSSPNCLKRFIPSLTPPTCTFLRSFLRQWPPSLSTCSVSICRTRTIFTSHNLTLRWTRTCLD